MSRRRPALRSLADVATGTARLARGLVPLRRATPRRLVRMAKGVSAHGLTLAGLTRVASIRDGRDVVLVDGDGAVTADQLDRWSATVAGELTRREILFAGNHLGVLCRSGRGFLLATIAASRVGADAVLLHPGSSSAVLAEVLRGEDIHVVVHDEEFGDLLAAARFRGTSILADASGPGLISLGAMAALPQADVPKPAHRGRLVLLMAARTGRPRHARRTPPGPASSLPLTTLLRRLEIRRGSSLLILPPLHHELGLAFMAVSLGLGCRAIVPGRFDASAALDLIEEHSVETLVVVPRMLHRLGLALGDRPRPAALRAVVCGGGPLHPAAARRALDRFGPIVHHLSGSAEAGSVSLARPADLAEAPGTIGPAAAGVEIAILDDAGEPVEPGAIGHVFVASAFASEDDDSRPRRGDLVDFGDLGHRDGAGRIFVDGPADEALRVGGELVFPGAVEDVLMDHPAVDDAAVTTGAGDVLVAHVVVRPGADVAGDDLVAHVAARLGRAARPGEVRFVTTIPLDDTGRPLLGGP